MIKKFLYFFGLFASVVGLVGGIGYAIYCKAYVIAICLAVVGYMAYPTAKKWFTELISQ